MAARIIIDAAEKTAGLLMFKLPDVLPIIYTSAFLLRQVAA
jgi:hypothetical protein